MKEPDTLYMLQEMAWYGIVVSTRLEKSCRCLGCHEWWVGEYDEFNDDGTPKTLASDIDFDKCVREAYAKWSAR